MLLLFCLKQTLTMTKMTQLDRAADEAVHILQLSSQQAKKYIQRNAKCSDKEAARAFSQTVTFHKR